MCAMAVGLWAKGLWAWVGLWAKGQPGLQGPVKKGNKGRKEGGSIFFSEIETATRNNNTIYTYFL